MGSQCEFYHIFHCLDKKELKILKKYIDHRQYENVVSGLINGEELIIPRKILVNKMNGKKRVVYSFSDEENPVLKQLGYRCLVNEYYKHKSKTLALL